MDMGAMLAGKRVLVTGASSGLGENFARLAARCKAKVVIGARRKSRLDALAVCRPTAWVRLSKPAPCRLSGSRALRFWSHASTRCRCSR